MPWYLIIHSEIRGRWNDVLSIQVRVLCPNILHTCWCFYLFCSGCSSVFTAVTSWVDSLPSFLLWLRTGAVTCTWKRKRYVLCVISFICFVCYIVSRPFLPAVLPPACFWVIYHYKPWKSAALLKKEKLCSTASFLIVIVFLRLKQLSNSFSLRWSQEIHELLFVSFWISELI